MIKQQPHFLILCTYVLILTVFALEVPFFWDTILFSKISHWFIDSGFTSLILPENLDTGNQPFFCLLLAYCWSAFGKTLIVSHLMIMPFLLGIAYQYWLIVKRFVEPQYYWIATLLFILEPTLMAQSTQVGIDIPLLFFYLLGLNAILNNKNLFLLIATIGLSLTNLRGNVAIGALFLTQLYLFKYALKTTIRHIQYYLPAAAIIILWFIYHTINSGWSFVQPNEWAEHRQIIGFCAMLKNLLFIIWHFIDFGRALPYLILFILIARKWLSGTINKEQEQLYILFLIPTLLFTLFFIPFSNPIGHRYYLISYIILLPIITINLSYLSVIYRRVLITAITIALLIGPFIVYPMPYSNGWDSTIAYLRYLNLRKEMRRYTTDQHIDPKTVAATYPHHADFRFTNLEENSYEYGNRGYDNINDYSYVLYSNISNSFKPAEVEELKNNWIIIERKDKWPIFMSLYKKK